MGHCSNMEWGFFQYGCYIICCGCTKRDHSFIGYSRNLTLSIAPKPYIDSSHILKKNGSLGGVSELGTAAESIREKRAFDSLKYEKSLEKSSEINETEQTISDDAAEKSYYHQYTFGDDSTTRRLHSMDTDDTDASEQYLA